MDEEKQDTVIDVLNDQGHTTLHSPSLPSPTTHDSTNSQEEHPSSTGEEEQCVADSGDPCPGDDSLEVPRPLTEIDFYIERNRARFRDPFSLLIHTDTALAESHGAVIDEILNHYVEPASVIQDSACRDVLKPRATLDELRATYNDVCDAVVEFEERVSTLRANSRSDSVMLAQALATPNSVGIFKALRDFEPRPRPNLHLSEETKNRLQEQFAQDIVTRPQSGRKERADAEHNGQGDQPINWRNIRSSCMKTYNSILELLTTRDLVTDTHIKNRPPAQERAQFRAWAREWEEKRAWLKATEDARELKDIEGPVLKLLKGAISVLKRLTPSNVRRNWRLSSRVRAEKARGSSAAASLWEFEKMTASSFNWYVHWSWAELMDAKRMKDWAWDWDWDLNWDHEWQLKSEQDWEKERLRIWRLTTDWPINSETKFQAQEGEQIGTWMMRLKKEIDILKKDQTNHSGHWDETVLLLQLVWWMDVESWSGRWGERRRAVDRFARTCSALVKELGNIDGSARSQELNVFFRSNRPQLAEASEKLQFVEHYVADMRDAMIAGDKARFMGSCNAILKLIAGMLRSNAIQKGLEILIKKQDHRRNSFMDFATIAIFFSSITASTLQFSFATANSSVLSTIVNVCWFSSLVLSIASATNSFLGAIVHQATQFLRPSQKFDRNLLQNWFKYMPSFLLAISGVLFLVGLCALTYSSTMQGPAQGKVTQLVTLSLTSTNFLAIVFIVLLAFTRVVHIGFGVVVILLTISYLTVAEVSVLGIALGIVSLVIGSTIVALLAAILFLALVGLGHCLSVAISWIFRCLRNRSSEPRSDDDVTVQPLSVDVPRLAGNNNHRV